MTDASSAPHDVPADTSARGSSEPTRPPQVEVHRDGDSLAVAVAARLLQRLADGQAGGRAASVVLTGGRTGTAVLQRLLADPRRETVDWSRVDVFWSDERFVESQDPERNDKQARAALLDHLPLDPQRVHAVAAADGVFGDDAHRAAEDYDRVVGDFLSAPGSGFDVCLLGVGEEGHVASIFPDSPAVREQIRFAVAVQGCPKPPPTRVSLSLPALGRAAEVWLMTTGAGKAEAVAAALAPGTVASDVPAAGVRGRTGTVWFLDEPAAALLS